MSPVPIAIVDYDTGTDRALLRDVAEAVTIWSQRDFGRAPPHGWGVSAVLRVAQSPQDVAPGEIVCGLHREADVPNALGYHNAPSGEPRIAVFPTMVGPEELGITIAHEVGELLADPEANACAQTADGSILALETCDPVEQSDYPIKVSSGAEVRVSNFVTPLWFGDPVPGGRYDYLGLCSGPRRLLAGGYQLVLDPVHGWTQQTTGSMRGYRARLAGLGLGRAALRRARADRPSGVRLRGPLDSLADLVTGHMPPSGRG